MHLAHLAVMREHSQDLLLTQESLELLVECLAAAHVLADLLRRGLRRIRGVHLDRIVGAALSVGH